MLLGLRLAFLRSVALLVHALRKCFNIWNATCSRTILWVPWWTRVIQRWCSVPRRRWYVGDARFNAKCVPSHWSVILRIVSISALNIFTSDRSIAGRGTVIWRDWYTHDVVENTEGQPVVRTFAAPLGHINVHVRDGSIILLHAKPASTVEETRQGPYSLLVSQSSQGLAFGTVYIDDGISNPPGPNRILRFISTPKKVNIVSVQGNFTVEKKLMDITVLGVDSRPTSVLLNGRKTGNWTYAPQQSKLVALEIDGDLNHPLSLEWI